METLLIDFLEAEILQIIINEEKASFEKETRPEVKEMRKKRIFEAQEINKKYLTILN